MPEGPSILILKEHITPLFKGKKIVKAFGNAKVDLTRLRVKLKEEHSFASDAKKNILCLNIFF